MDAGSSANTFLGRAGNRLKYAAVSLRSSCESLPDGIGGVGGPECSRTTVHCVPAIHVSALVPVDILCMLSSPLTPRSHGVSLCQVVVKDAPGAFKIVQDSKGGRPSCIVRSQELTIQALRVGVVAAGC